jgi:MFS family permease
MSATFPMNAQNPTAEPIPMPAPEQVARAIRLTYAQMMLSAVFGASTGGMFLVGFAIALGADNVLLGLMTSVPQFFVCVQFLVAFLVERQVSRKKLTVIFSFLQPLCWFLIAAIPFLGEALNPMMRLGWLTVILALVTVAGHFIGNARASWLGELIPAERRGKFFGYCGMFAGIVGATFAIGEGWFLDIVRSKGLLAFTALFFFGSLFGIFSAALNIPQPDCPLPRGKGETSYGGLIRETFRNRPLVALAIAHAVIAMSAIAGPFNAAYCLRDIGMSFLGLGLLNAVVVGAMLIAAPFMGRWVDRFGCRPVLIVSLLVLGPCALVWVFVPPHALMRAYWLLPWTNFIAGIASAGLNVSITTLMYKVSTPHGRSVQFAVYSTFVGLVGAPMPLVGGWLVSTLEKSGYPIDLRLTFYIWAILLLASAWVATRIKEEGAVHPHVFVLYVSGRIPRWFGTVFPWMVSTVEEDEPPPKN